MDDGHLGRLTWEPRPVGRVLQAPGAEAHVGDLLAELGAQRVWLCCTARHRAGADRVAALLAGRCVGVFDGCEPQVPATVAERARREATQTRADWVVAHGGGTAIGVAKAVALEVDVSVAAIPTTYAGSEMTSIWGITDGGVKTTGRADRVRPRLVIHDPELVAGLRPGVARNSLYNAMAHSVEAMYAADATDQVRDDAERSVVLILAGLRGLAAHPGDLEAAASAQRGAALAGDVLDKASMGLHHKLAHVLGGSFGTPHAETHAALLPHTLAFNLGHAPDAAVRLRRALATDDPAGLLFDLAQGWGMPQALAPLGVGLEDIHRVVSLALLRRYANPRPLDADALAALLDGAVRGRRPQ